MTDAPTPDNVTSLAEYRAKLLRETIQLAGGKDVEELPPHLLREGIMEGEIDMEC